MYQLPTALLIATIASCTALHGAPVPTPHPQRTTPAVAMERLRAEVYVAEKGGDMARSANGLRQIRDLQVSCGALDSALRTGIRIVTMSGVADDRMAMAGDWQAMARIYERLGSYSEAVDAEKRALLILRTTNDPKLVRSATLDLLDLLLTAKRYSEFKHASDEALRDLQRNGDRKGRARALLLQGECLIRQGRSADALSILHLALRDSMGISGPEEKAHGLFLLSNANADIGNWAVARSEFDRAKALDPDALVNTPLLHGLCARIDEGGGDLSAALRCERLLFEGTDSLRKADRTDHMMQLQALYALKQKDRDMSLLRATNRSTTDALASARWEGRITMTLSLLLLGTIVLLLLMRGRHAGTLRRARMKNAVIHRQADEIHRNNIELEQQNLRLRNVLENERAKDLVLKDVHHRTKNSMQLVSTLLKMQGIHANDPRLEALLHDCQGRIHSMALVHEHIYKYGDLDRVNVKAHFVALADAVLRHHGLDHRMNVEFDISHDRSRLEELTPLSLLFNELLTNSAKHASTRNRSGRILVVLRPLAEHRCEFLFTDEGTGLEQERFLHTDSFGAELVRTLAKQLNGTIHLLKSEVLTFQMTFDNADGEEIRLAS